MKINFRAGECYLCLLMCDIVVVISFPRKGKETSKAGEGILSEIFFLVYSVSRKNPSVSLRLPAQHKARPSGALSGKPDFLGQYHTKIVRQMRRQIFRQMKQKAE